MARSKEARIHSLVPDKRSSAGRDTGKLGAAPPPVCRLEMKQPRSGAFGVNAPALGPILSRASRSRRASPAGGVKFRIQQPLDDGLLDVGSLRFREIDCHRRALHRFDHRRCWGRGATRSPEPRAFVGSDRG